MEHPSTILVVAGTALFSNSLPFPVPFGLPPKKPFNSSVSLRFKTPGNRYAKSPRPSQPPKIRMPTALTVIGHPATAEVARVLTCLFEKNLHFQIIRTDTFKGVHMIPEFLKLKDPSGQVIFKDGDSVLVDSREICRYVANAYADKGNKTLCGTGFLERASVEQWQQREAQSFDPPSSTLVFNLAFAPLMGMEPDQAAVERSKKELIRVLDVYEQKLGMTEYLAGDDFTIVDLSHLPNAHHLVADERCRSLFSARKNVAKWWEAISGRASWKTVVRMQQEHPHIV